MTDENDLEFFRLKVRLQILERLVLRLAVEIHSDREVAIQSLKRHLETASAKADQKSGQDLRDPALAELYAGEVREIVDSLQAFVDGLSRR